MAAQSRTSTLRALRRALRLRLAAEIPEGTGAQIKNLCEALLILEGANKLGADMKSDNKLVVRFVGDDAEAWL